MQEFAYLKDLAVILSVAVVVVIVFHRLKLPSIAGLILSGILVGPKGLALINNVHQVEVLAEIGVALLLFGIGVELALGKLKRLWKLALIGGLLQVGITTAVGFAVCRFSGLQISSSVLIGFIVALSSTAIVLRGLQQRGEIDAPHGRLILGILVFQDFSVVPIMLIIPLLASANLSAVAFVVALGKSIGIVIAVLLLAMFIVPRILRLVALTRQRQLFILSVIVVCIGTAWAVTKSGASLAIGAFLAGLVVSGSEYRHQAMADMISFREVFASLFFVSVGMLLTPLAILGNIGTIIAILIAILLGKAVIVFITAKIMRMPPRACLVAAVSLAQVGEFSFILLHITQSTGFISQSLESSLVSATILSMLVTPFAMSFAPKLAAGLGRFTRFQRLLDVDSAEEAGEVMGKMREHVIVAGYGFAGRELSQVLDDHKIPYVIVDLNIENVRRASQEKRKVVYGDVTSEGVLGQLGIAEARELVLLINDPSAAELAIRVARNLAPNLFITVRTFYLLDVARLLAAGADEVIPAEREAAVQVATQLLTRHRINLQEIANEALVIREHSEDEVW